MKKSKLFLIVNACAALALLSCPPVHAQEENSFALAAQSGVLMEGQYPTTQSSVAVGSGWLALQKTERGWELVPTEIQTLLIPSASGKLLMDVSSPLPRVQAILKHDRLKTGPVKTVKLADGSLQPTFAKSPEGYRTVSVSKAPLAQSFKVDTLASTAPLIVFTTGSGTEARSTVIGKAPFSTSSNYTAVLWMGDLDRDGKVDLITQESDRPQALKLWLSSEAKEKEALAQAN